MDQRFKCKTRKYKTLTKQEKLHDTGFGDDFLDMIPNAQATKEKLDKLNFTKIKNCVHQRTLSTE